ncbi:MAG: hypothetical protein WC884_02565 [Candidatus Paceibacterota bacterium]
MNIAYAQSPSIFFSNPPKQVQEGDRLTIDVRIRSSLRSVNAISGVLFYPSDLVRVISISKEKSIISLWIEEPRQSGNRILFEGVILNPGFQDSNGLVFRITLEARKKGTVVLNFSEGAVLANDGLGTNILATLGAVNFKIIPGPTFFQDKNIVKEYIIKDTKLAALPVIIDYSSLVESNDAVYLKGKGEPNALTKIIFSDISLKSVGEQFVGFFQNKKKKLTEVLVKNDASGVFQYISGSNLIAGVYNATPFLVDNNTNTEKPGLGVQLLVKDSEIVKILVVVINVLGLLIPIVGLGVIIYFIPWYSWKRMRVLKKKLGLEEEKIEITGHQLERQEKIQDKMLEKNTEQLVNGEKQ